MGNLLTKAFLALQSPTWVSKYVRTFFSLAAPWKGGSGAVFNSVIIGYNGGLPINQRAFRGIQVNSPASYACLPVDLADPPRIFIQHETDGWMVFAPTAKTVSPVFHEEIVTETTGVIP
ncbi:hypothetical protein GEMRC1_009380 [Eukaryota sp. GEM-RC1]